MALYTYNLAYSYAGSAKLTERIGSNHGNRIGAAAIAVRWRWLINLPIPTLPIGSVSLVASYVTWVSIAVLFVFWSSNRHRAG